MPLCWWKEPSLTLLDNTYQPSEERTQNLQKNVNLIGLVFGSFRNRSTKHFIKYLNKFYVHTQEQNESFEIVYVPLDEDEQDCQFLVSAVMGDWLSVPWSNQGLRRNVRNMYNVLDQPWLVVVKNDEKGSMVTFEGKSDLLDYGYFCLKEWKAAAEKNVETPPT